ncbi:MAG: M81 family metallopeptidase [Clostridiaceae bacterium]|nr:M81 family metallopeptidase [Clostridiaceae bacterium]
MLIVVGSIQQETNSFNPELSGTADFSISEREDMLPRIAVTEYLESEGCEIAPTLYAHAVPAGRLSAAAFQALLQRMLDLFPTDKPIDGVWLYCHGALNVEQIGSGDAVILEAVRRKVGSDVPIAVAVDFHANLNERIAAAANIICGYRTAPHTDMPETQLRAAKALVAAIRGHDRPACALVRVPLVLTGDKVITAVEPMRRITETAAGYSREQGILDASVFNGQPWVDGPDTGASALVVAVNKSYLAKAAGLAGQLAQMLWQARDRYQFQALVMDADSAVKEALAQTAAPVFISDSGDNTTAGAPGNRTDLLSQLLKHPLRQVLLAGLTDPETLAACSDLEPGGFIPEQARSPLLSLLRQSGRRPLLKCRGRILGWDGEDAGRGMVLAADGLDIILTERRCAFISPEIIESAGVRFQDYRIIAVKLGYLYPDLAAAAQKAYLALTPGASCETIETIPYRHISRPVYPLDLDFIWKNTMKTATKLI